MCRYEAVFYAALALVLMAWILFENTILNLNILSRSSVSTENIENNLILGYDNRPLQLSDVRIPLVFVSPIPFSFVFPHNVIHYEILSYGSVSACTVRRMRLNRNPLNFTTI